MNNPAAPITPARPRKAPPDSAPAPAITNPATLQELLNARLTYSYLRQKGDPAQFWEALLLARNGRALVVPDQRKPVTITPESDGALQMELEAIRADAASLVLNLRRLLEGAPRLPDPADRLEMALAFLLASPRDRQAAARWLEYPEDHREQAAKKLQSLAAVSDPYREALLPWTIDPVRVGSGAAGTAKLRPDESVRPKPDPTMPRAAPSIDAKRLDTVRMALRCRELLTRLNFRSEVWETLLLAITEPGALRTTLEKTAPAAATGRLQEVRADLELLFGKVSDLRQVYAEWVRLLHAHMVEQRSAPGDRWAFEVGLGLLLAETRHRDRLGYWIQDPVTWQDEAAGLLAPCIRLAEEYLAALKE
jgi:hypothetical protein